MLEVCHTLIAISDNLKAMGLKEQKTVNAIQRQTKPHQGKKPPADSVHSCGRFTKSHLPGRSSFPARDDHWQGCGKLGHWKPKCQVDKKDPRTRDPNTTTEEENRGRSMKLELMKTPIVMKLVLSQLFCRHHLTGND